MIEPVPSSEYLCRRGAADAVSCGATDLTMFRKRTVWRYVRWLFLLIPGMKPRAVKRNVLVALLYLLLFGLSVSVVLRFPMG